MHPRIVELLEYAELQRVALFAAVSRIPEPLRDCRSAPETWSAAEVLEHLHRVESGIVRLLHGSLDRAKAAGLDRETELSSMLGSLDALRLLDRRRRINAPELVMPRGELTAAQGIAGMIESRQGLVALLQEADGLALGRITQAHPLFGPLNMYQWVLFVGQHEARHASQLQDVARRLVRME